LLLVLLPVVVCRIFPILYAIAKPWLDPVTRAKVIRRVSRRISRLSISLVCIRSALRLQIVVVKGDIKETMLKDFDADQLPTGNPPVILSLTIHVP
jgi:hypothetical protein